MSDVFEQIRIFEQKFNLPDKFYSNLLNESDWGFIIKLHSLFEGASTHILSLRLGDGKLESAFSFLDFSNTKYGKSKLLYDLDILSKEQLTFLRVISELRNELVHRIENVHFSFQEYIQSFDKNQKKSFCDKIGYNGNDPVEISGITVSRDQFICENPKLVIWLTSSDILACLRVEEEFVKLEQEKKEQKAKELALSNEMLDRYSQLFKIIESKNGA